MGKNKKDLPSKTLSDFCNFTEKLLSNLREGESYNIHHDGSVYKIVHTTLLRSDTEWEQTQLDAIISGGDQGLLNKSRPFNIKTVSKRLENLKLNKAIIVNVPSGAFAIVKSETELQDINNIQAAPNLIKNPQRVVSSKPKTPVQGEKILVPDTHNNSISHSPNSPANDVVSTPIAAPAPRPKLSIPSTQNPEASTINHKTVISTGGGNPFEALLALREKFKKPEEVAAEKPIKTPKPATPTTQAKAEPKTDATTGAKIKRTYDDALEKFANKPMDYFRTISKGDILEFTAHGKEFKIVRRNMLGDGIDLSKNTLNLNTPGLTSHNKSFNPAQLSNLVKNLGRVEALPITFEDGVLCIVHAAVGLTNSRKQITVERTEDLKEIDLSTVEEMATTPKPQALKPSAAQIRVSNFARVIDGAVSPKEEEKPNQLPAAIELPMKKNADSKPSSASFKEYYWAHIVSPNRAKPPSEKSPYDFLQENAENIILLHYQRRQIPLGFMMNNAFFRKHTEGNNAINREGRFKISHFSKAMKGRWASSPFEPNTVTVSNEEHPRDYSFITIGAALKLRETALFKNAPQFIQDHLNDADQAKSNPKRTVSPAKTQKQSTDAQTAAPVQPKFKEATTQTPAPAPTPVVATPKIAEQTNTTATDLISQSKNAMAALQRAIIQAKNTNELLKVAVEGLTEEQSVFAGSNKDAIQAMEEAISFANEMGFTAPEITRIKMDSTSMSSVMSALKGAWSSASTSNALVILEPTQGQRIAMTRNQDLLSAYRMGLQ